MVKAKPHQTAPQSSEATPENDLAGLMRTRENLQARQAALTTDTEKAMAERRALLIAGTDAAGIADAERRCREAEGAAFGITDALKEVDRLIADTEARIEQDRQANQREDVAARLERDSQAIDAAAAKVRKAVDDLAKANAALASAISPIAAPLFAKRDMHGMRDGDSPETIASFIVGYMLASTISTLEVSEAGQQMQFGWKSAKPIELTEGNAPAVPLLVAPMRELAERIRTGEASPDLRAYAEPEPNFDAHPGLVQIYVLQRFSYLTKREHVPELVSVSRTHLPEPVARLAIAQGVASETEPFNWRRLSEASQSGPQQNIPLSAYPPIGFVLEDWKKAEAEKARNAWLAERRQAA
ncbi:hypothetical protein [Methylobacterium bullatum]|uniref:Chromosome partition protein Smc n=1 Tax=Methylobacterium bullatum TaxID=570505 RepID=A0AAV4Z911_9HYPH|nr:hypothetical protein [Methylobacterium bullatum]MBD8901398.1 hypothetical protein [Methylobacterium bullatum]GJD40093.1 hypothetical protein OICFNHDK_2558 [Methylobacterium bullatum]